MFVHLLRCRCVSKCSFVCCDAGVSLNVHSFVVMQVCLNVRSFVAMQVSLNVHSFVAMQVCL